MFRPLLLVRMVKIDNQPVLCTSRAFLMNFLPLLPSSPLFLSHSLSFSIACSLSSLQHLYPSLISVFPLGLSSLSWLFFFYVAIDMLRRARDLGRVFHDWVFLDTLRPMLTTRSPSIFHTKKYTASKSVPFSPSK
jgi:hypothetical protein